MLLIGLAAKNAILIVEFARDRFAHGAIDVRETAEEGARTRYRPVMMTALERADGASQPLYCEPDSRADRGRAERADA